MSKLLHNYTINREINERGTLYPYTLYSSLYTLLPIFSLNIINKNKHNALCNCVTIKPYNPLSRAKKEASA